MESTDSIEGKITKKNPARAVILMEDGKSWGVYYNNILSKSSSKKIDSFLWKTLPDEVTPKKKEEKILLINTGNASKYIENLI